MKSVSTALASHLAGEALTLATLWRVVRRDGQVFCYTDHDQDIVYGGETYVSTRGYERAAVTSGADLAVDETELRGFATPGSVEFFEIRAGMWDGAQCRFFAVNWADLTQGELKVRRATLGEFITADDGSFRVEIRGLTQPLQATIGGYYQPECRADLGDRRCRVPIAPPRWSPGTSYAVGDYVCADVTGGALGNFYDEAGIIFECTAAGTSGGSQPAFDLMPGNTTADGSVTWTARVAWTKPAEIGAVTDSATYVLADDGIIGLHPDAWFEGGVCTWDTGDNAGAVREIIGWTQASRTLSLLAPPPFAPAPGDVLRLQPGCDKRWQTCHGKFANRLNFRGEPLVPGTEAIVGGPP